MPLYEYECGACGGRFELIRKFSDPPVQVCSLCGKGPVQRQMSSPAIQFKGSGWYITDYSQKGKTGKSDTASTNKTTEGKGASAGKSEGTSSDAAAKPAASSSTAGGSKD